MLRYLQAQEDKDSRTACDLITDSTVSTIRHLAEDKDADREAMLGQLYADRGTGPFDPGELHRTAVAVKRNGNVAHVRIDWGVPSGTQANLVDTAGSRRPTPVRRLRASADRVRYFAPAMSRMTAACGSALALASIVSACGASSSSPPSSPATTATTARSARAYCEAYYRRAAPLHGKYVSLSIDADQSSDDAVAVLIGTITAPGELAVVFDEMVPAAPAEIEPETVAVRDALRKVQNNLADSASDPAKGLLGGMVTGTSAEPALETIGAYLQEHCPLDSPIARRYITLPDPTSTTSSEAATDTAGTPEVGDVLATNSGAGAWSVITSADGFSIVRALVDISGDENTDRSTVTVYDASGDELSEIPEGSLDGRAGAADVVLPDGQRLILTIKTTTSAAEGIHDASSATSLTAWDATSGTERWTTPLGDADRADCGPDHEGLCGFTATTDGQWGVVAGNATSLVIDLTNGDARAVDAEGAELSALGNGLIQVTNDDSANVVDPSTLKATASAPEVNAAQRDGGSIAASSDGAVVYGIQTKSVVHATQKDGRGYSDEVSLITARSMPDGEVLWQREGAVRNADSGDNVDIDTIYGTAGAVLLAGRDGYWLDHRELAGYDTRTGEPAWHVSLAMGSEEDARTSVCGFTGSQVMVAVNDQLAILDPSSGEQLSYDDSESVCPLILAGGIGVEYGAEDPMAPASHGVTVTQVLEP